MTAEGYSFEVRSEEAGERLDRLIARRLGQSRSVTRRMIEEGLVRVDGVREFSPSRRLSGGEHCEAWPVDEKPDPEDILVPIV
ncbi:MAG: hypothetical protein ICV57_02465, partial [Rubrobacter sp.]|nr:hypothetical protein [Rubrobacter sp.]